METGESDYSDASSHLSDNSHSEHSSDNSDSEDSQGSEVEDMEQTMLPKDNGQYDLSKFTNPRLAPGCAPKLAYQPPESPTIGRPSEPADEWCKCGNCKPMKYGHECVCCMEVTQIKDRTKDAGIVCITTHASFKVRHQQNELCRKY